MKILSLDGGGSRGVISLIFLKRLEEYIGCPLNTKFDLICGSSTGSIIGSLISLGYTSETILDIYLKLIPKIFSKKNENWLSPLGLRPKYKIEKLIEESRNILGDICLNEINKVKLLIIAYDTLRDKPLFLKSWEDELNLNLKLWQTVCMSSACPTIFPSFTLDINGVNTGICDGALAVSNPILAGIAEAVEEGNKIEDIKVVSIGTGDEAISVEHETSKKGGLIYWGTLLPKLLLSSGNDLQTELSNKIIKNVYRLQIPLYSNNLSISLNGDIDTREVKDIEEYITVTNWYTKEPNIIEIYENIKQDLFNTSMPD